jgi:hypothetical protein
VLSFDSQAVDRNNAVPSTSVLAATIRPVLNDNFTCAPALREFTDELFDALNRRFAPQGTGFVEASKLIALAGLYASYSPSDVSALSCKWRTKALFKAFDAEYVKTKHGDALTKAGFAAYYTMDIILRPDLFYLVSSVLAVELGLTKHFVRQQFPHSLTPEVEARRQQNVVNMFRVQYQKFYMAPPLSAATVNNNGTPAAATQLFVEAVKWYINK